MFAHRIKESSVSSGIGTMTLLGAVALHKPFSSATNSPAGVYYLIEYATGYEIGFGEFNGVNQLTRDLVVSSSLNSSPVGIFEESSASGLALVDLPPGEKTVSLIAAAMSFIAAPPGLPGEGDVRGPLASGKRSMAAGVGAVADVDDSIAMGFGAWAVHPGAIRFGNGDTKSPDSFTWGGQLAYAAGPGQYVDSESTLAECIVGAPAFQGVLRGPRVGSDECWSGTVKVCVVQPAGVYVCEADVVVVNSVLNVSQFKIIFNDGLDILLSFSLSDLGADQRQAATGLIQLGSAGRVFAQFTGARLGWWSA